MHKHILFVGLWTVLLFFGGVVPSGAADSEGPPPCPGAVSGFMVNGMAGTGISATEWNRPPGKITGGVNSSPTNVIFEKGGTLLITGGVNGSPVDLEMDPATGKITGGANGSRADLTVSSNGECTFIEGGANGSPVRLRIDWGDGVLSGYSNHSAVRIEFREGQGTQGAVVKLEGYANHGPVDLTYDQRSGRLTGGMGTSKTDLTFSHVGLEAFIDYFFLFLNP